MDTPAALESDFNSYSDLSEGEQEARFAAGKICLSDGVVAPPLIQVFSLLFLFEQLPERMGQC